MASLTAKIINGHKYYYARICKRVNGKPKILKTIYLGTVDKMIENAQRAGGPAQAEEVFIAELGATAALLQIADRLQLVQIVDRHAPKRQQGPSVGQYMLIAAINRASHPTSKAKLADWFEQTVGPRLLGVQPRQLTSQSFWNHMDRLSPEILIDIENDLLGQLVEEFHIDLDCLFYDATNFYTYIDTNTPSELAERGQNKQKRNDLRQVSLGMMTSADFHVPLLHMVYGGKMNDSTQFGSVIDELVRRYKHLTEACPQITLIFDKGNNSEDNILALADTDMHFVGSLKLNQCKDLLEIPLKDYRVLETEGLKEVRVNRAKLHVFAEERTVLVTYNENLIAGQLQGIGSNIAKTKKELHAYQTKLRRATGKVRRGRKPTLASTERKVNNILGREYMKDIFNVKLTEVDGFVKLVYKIDPNAIARLSRTVLGKTILFTDNDDWSDEQIIFAYRGQYHIEHAFREMKDPHFLAWDPRFHWTDQKIRVHAFYCVTALTLVSLLRRELAAYDISLSAKALIENLNGIRETISVYPQGPNNPPKLSYSLSHLNDIQKQLYNLLYLSRFRQT